jgi:hypothetical protein
MWIALSNSISWQNDLDIDIVNSCKMALSCWIYLGTMNIRKHRRVFTPCNSMSFIRYNHSSRAKPTQPLVCVPSVNLVSFYRDSPVKSWIFIRVQLKLTVSLATLKMHSAITALFSETVGKIMVFRCREMF